LAEEALADAGLCEKQRDGAAFEDAWYEPVNGGRFALKI
jgi:hypothetical protein